MSKCKNCRYCTLDYILDEEISEDIDIIECSKKHEYWFDTEKNACELFEEKEPVEPYKEKNTVCDTCKNLRHCIECDNAVEVTSIYDTIRRHFQGPVTCGNYKSVTDE